MESPFYGSYWPTQPSRRRYTPKVNGYPVYPVQHKTVDVAPKPSTKIVQIPVHFVGSESTRTAAALKIQKVFRGFLVRRSMNRIMSVAREVDVIERRVSESETVELLRRDEREIIRVNEALMSLLFKLDSVVGVDSGVRVCRKAVTRKAVALQERIDAIVNSNHRTETAENQEIGDSEAARVCDLSDSEQPESFDINNSSEDVLETGNAADQSDNSVQIDVENKDNGVEESVDFPVEANCPGKDDCNEAESDEAFVSEVSHPKALIEGDEEKNESLEMAETRNGEDENRENRELLEKMMEENGKMMRLMTQLSERNEAQTKILDALTQRVGNLEKAFMCDRLRRKKMKKKHSP